METSVTITPKFQVSIPVSIRKYLKLTKHGKATMKAMWVNGKQEMVLRPDDSDILNLAGKYAHKKPVRKVDVDNIRDLVDYSQW